jgi:hypothetical protein
MTIPSGSQSSILCEGGAGVNIQGAPFDRADMAIESARSGLDRNDLLEAFELTWN